MCKLLNIRTFHVCKLVTSVCQWCLQNSFIIQCRSEYHAQPLKTESHFTLLLLSKIDYYSFYVSWYWYNNSKDTQLFWISKRMVFIEGQRYCTFLLRRGLMCKYLFKLERSTYCELTSEWVGAMSSFFFEKAPHIKKKESYKKEKGIISHHILKEVVYYSVK